MMMMRLVRDYEVAHFLFLLGLCELYYLVLVSFQSFSVDKGTI
jgi:hypothetical protein